MEDLITITKSDGKKYTIRKDRRRYFFPDEWIKFIDSFKNKKHKLLFNLSLHCGGRIMEVLHVKPRDIDFDRGTISLEVVKHRAAKKRFATGKSRTFFISPKMIRELKYYKNKFKVEDNQYFFLNNKKLPEKYEELSNKNKKEYFNSCKISYGNMLKSHLKKIGIKDYRDFSLHNIRKTYGNWMRLFISDMDELCYRMGHDKETFMKHYGSSLLFESREKIKIQKIMGEVR